MEVCAERGPLGVRAETPPGAPNRDSPGAPHPQVRLKAMYGGTRNTRYPRGLHAKRAQGPIVAKMTNNSRQPERHSSRRSSVAGSPRGELRFRVTLRGKGDSADAIAAAELPLGSPSASRRPVQGLGGWL